MSRTLSSVALGLAFACTPSDSAPKHDSGDDSGAGTETGLTDTGAADTGAADTGAADTGAIEDTATVDTGSDGPCAGRTVSHELGDCALNFTLPDRYGTPVSLYEFAGDLILVEISGFT